jgi:hypothetical protein
MAESGSSTDFNALPDWYTDTSKAASGFVQDYLSQISSDLVGSGYDQPRVADFSALQTQAMGYAPNAMGAWQQPMQGALTTVQNAAMYDPAQMQQHLSPYLSGVNQEIARLGTQNMTEQLLPAVNSTFTGAGQFGSTRNAEFTNRAMRDVNQNIIGAQAQAMNSAYDNAARDYLGWAQQGVQAGSTQGQLGQNMANVGWTDLTNLYNMGLNQQQLQQKLLDTAHTDWQEQWKMPVDLTGALTKMIPYYSQELDPTKSSVQYQIIPENTTMSDLSSVWGNLSGLNWG